MYGNNFTAWQESVRAEEQRLLAVEPYLNADGKARLAAYGVLAQMAGLCSGAGEMIEWLESQNDLDDPAVVCLENEHADAPLRALRLIARRQP